ncbi:FYDLN acid domain-containing protein [Paracoccus rhizosphaerae]|uniref:FYDLN acid domain-containing protein n=1 Tax=Paracoccus rhizosphaerae TaxID=1133347 RepID=A0ABV6CEF6_9RHOB|nr:FYDLN acid domain-containing protein [Paracoccus rhizosphaerae]
MPKEEWGTKRLCPHCATRFYDLQADPMTCPACGNQFTLDSLTDGRGKTLVSEKTSARNQNDDLVDDDEDIADESGEIDDDLLEEDDDDGDVSLDDIADVADDDED